MVSLIHSLAIYFSVQYTHTVLHMLVLCSTATCGAPNTEGAHSSSSSLVLVASGSPYGQTFGSDWISKGRAIRAARCGQDEASFPKRPKNPKANRASGPSAHTDGRRCGAARHTDRSRHSVRRAHALQLPTSPTTTTTTTMTMATKCFVSIADRCSFNAIQYRIYLTLAATCK
uniref:Putative secreted protein n=1 Tax=Anopheles triannulatus TaxID=58253 RepID=A0A2M4B1H6_9DIPT